MTPIDHIERVRNRLAVFLVSAFVGVIPFLLFKNIPKDNSDIVVYMVGQLSGMATTVLGFYFVNKVGQDALDAKKTENTGEAFAALKEVARAGGGLSADALQSGDTVVVSKEEPDAADLAQEMKDEAKE